MNLTVQQLAACMPGLHEPKLSQYLPLLVSAMTEGHIDTRLRIAAFLAQLGHESVDLKHFEELSSGQAYEGRSDLGNHYQGDGKRFKGRGPIQLTGRVNYRMAGCALGIDLEGRPELAALPEHGFRIAVWFWATRGLNSYADAENFDMITRRINGGTNGKADRDARYRRCLAVFPEAEEPINTTPFDLSALVDLTPHH
jgi:putative chitinase